MKKIFVYFNKREKAGLAVLALAVFMMTFSVYYSVYLAKGFIPVQYYNLIPARNWAATGSFSYESPENVVLSTETSANRGMAVTQGNNLIFYLYGLLFKIFGFYPELPLYTTFILYSISAVFLFFTVVRIFDVKIGLLAAALSVISPFSLPPSDIIGHHEWAYLFLTLSAFFYFPKNKEPENGGVSLILTGLFLGLSMAAKNSFFTAFLPFLALEFYRNRSNFKSAVLRMSILLTAFLIIAVPFTFRGGNSYLDIAIGNSAYLDKITGNPAASTEYFNLFGHLFPDPYTFHYAREEFLKTLLINKNNYPGGEFAFWGDTSMFLEEYGLKVGFIKAQILTRIYSAWIYFKGLFLSLIVFGGALTWFLIFMGAGELAKKKNHLALLFISTFFASWFFFLIFLKTSNYAQFLILTLPLSMVISVGLYKTGEIISERAAFLKISSEKILIFTVILFLIMFSQISWWRLRELYIFSGPEKELIRFAREKMDIYPFDKDGVIAVGFNSNAPNLFNYYFNRDFIYFAPATIEKISGKKELNSVFERYRIAGFIGYGKETTKIINENTGYKLKNYLID